MTVPVCQIGEAGISRPDYDEVVAWVKDQFRAIYGPDIYLEPDSQDGQLCAIFALAMHDTNTMAVNVYRSFSPSTAPADALSSNVKINGIGRSVATYSSVDLRIVGEAGAIIANGIASDTAGVQWALPASVTIPLSGEIVVTALCRTIGAVNAAIGAVNAIATPTRGWQSVTNLVAATPGAPVETDAQLRARQKISTALPSRTILEGINGAIANLAGVKRLKLLENDTGTTNADGLPPHSIAAVVDGGDTAAIAQQIFARKSPGVSTYGTTNHVITDSFGVANTIRFFRPTAAVIKVTVTLTALPGYTVAIEGQIIASIAAYLNSRAIAEDVIRSRLFVPAQLGGGVGSETFEVTNIQLARGAAALGTADIALAFNEAAQSGAIVVAVI